MGRVYVGEEVDGSARVAIKVLETEVDDAERDLLNALFDVEIEALRRMDHPHGVRLLGFGDGPRFLVMPFVDGSRLGDVLLSGPLPWSRVSRIARQLTDVLAHAHSRGIVHRDVKPSNVLLGVGDHITLLDFGVARIEGREDPTGRADPERVFGSPHSVAPEQVTRQSTDARTDIYGLGILMFRLLTGTWPFSGSGRRATLDAHLDGDVPSFQSAAPAVQVEDGVESLVRRCLSRSPAARFPDAPALRAAIDAIDRPPVPWLLVVSLALVVVWALVSW